MQLREFIAVVPGFAKLPHAEKYKHFAWWLHTHGKKERFDLAAIRGCYTALDMQPPANPSQELIRLAERRPKEVLKDAAGYRLEHQVRDGLTKKYGEHEATIVTSQLLKDLLGKVSDDAERLFLSEALLCYRHRAFRAATVMTWNVAYDHLLNWILKDAARLSAFHTTIVPRVGAKRGAGIVIAKREDFEQFTEREVLDMCVSPGVLPSGNIKKLLIAQLDKRNMAAHPSLIEIGEPSANETIHMLVANVVLKLT